MISKIPLESLRVGMFVHDLNCSWMDHPFAQEGFLVTDEAMLVQIRELSVRQLYIDSARAVDNRVVAPARVSDTSAAQPRVEKTAIKPGGQGGGSKSFRSEAPMAMAALKEANRLVSDMMDQARHEHRLDLGQSADAVGSMLGSLQANPDVLLALTKIRDVDRYTFQHSVSVCVQTLAFCKYLGMDEATLLSVGNGALLHDIGKVKTPEAILMKPGKLSDAEFRIMRNHVIHSKIILAQSQGIDAIALSLAAEHHERFDGAGYPNKLAGDKISRYGQIAAITDVYDAITSDRCYHRGLPPTEALRRLYEWSESQFNPELVRHFIHFVGVYPPGSIVELESRHLALVLGRGEEPLSPRVRIIFDTNRNRPVSPRDVSLKDTDDRVLAYAVPERWGIDPQRLLRLML